MSPYVALGELISQPTSLDRGISAEASQSNPIPVRHQGRRDEDRAQGRGQRTAITTGRRNRGLAGLANLFVSSRTSAVMGGAQPETGVRRARAVQRCFLPHRGTEAGWTRASTGWVKVKGGSFSSKELLSV